MSFTAEEQARLKIPLYDWVHATFPNENLRRYRWITDDITTAYMIAAIGLQFYVPNYHFPFFLVVVGICYIIRTMCCSLMILPQCRHPNEELERELATFDTKWLPTWLNRVRKQWFQTQNGSHHDLLFSGHCTMIVSIMWHWTFIEVTHDNRVFGLTGLCLLWGLAGITSFCICLFRCHYIPDILLAWFVTTAVYLSFLLLSILPRIVAHYCKQSEGWEVCIHILAKSLLLKEVDT